MKYLLLVMVCLVGIAECSLARAQTLNGNVLRLVPSTLSITCNNGDIRTDANDSYKLKKCGLVNNWSEITPTGAIINPMTTAGDLIVGGVTGTPARLAIGATNTVLKSTGSSAAWGAILNANIDAAAAIDYSKLNLTGAILNADLAGSIADTKLSQITTAGKVANSATTADAANTASAIVARDGSGNFAAGTITAALTGNVTGNVSGSSGSTTGNAATATALAANPSDCAADTYATTIAANGNLTCGTVTSAGLAGNIDATKIADGSVTSTEFQYINTLSSNAQTQLGLLAPKASPTFSGTFTGPWTTAGPLITSAGGVVTSEAALAIARGGTNNTSLSVTSGSVLYTDGSKVTALGIGTTNQVLTVSGGLPTWAAAVAGSPPGAYRYIGSYPNSASNYWARTSASYGDFTITGAIPPITAASAGNSGITVANATSNLPGVSFTAPRTGTIRVSMLVAVLPGQNASAAPWGIQLYETTTAAVFGADVGASVGNNASANAEWIVPIIGYLNVTGTTAYNIKLQGKISAGTIYIGAVNSAGSCLVVNLEYVE